MKLYAWLILSVAFYLVMGRSGNTVLPGPADPLPAASPTPVQSQAARNPGDDQEIDQDCRLFVKGVDITGGNHVKFNFEHHYVELPLTATVKALGAKVEWKSETTAEITFGDKHYLLNVTEGSLVEAGTAFHIIIVAPGQKHAVYHRAIGGELIVDSDSMKLLLQDMGVKRIIIDDDALTVHIE